MELSEYLLQRGLTLEPIKIRDGEDLILADKELTQAAGELWNGKQNLITLIIQNRVNAIGKELLVRAVPQETIVLRQAMVEISAILGDLAKYHAESERQKAREPQAEEEPPAEEIPAEEDNNSSL